MLFGGTNEKFQLARLIATQKNFSQEETSTDLGNSRQKSSADLVEDLSCETIETVHARVDCSARQRRQFQFRAISLIRRQQKNYLGLERLAFKNFFCTSQALESFADARASDD